MNQIKLAFIRQKYRPDGGAERFLVRAIDALKEEVELTILTREWTAQDGVKIIKCDPPKYDRVSREKGFAQEVCAQISKNNFDLVQSHERIPCCDIYRAGDGVHREWLKQRHRVISPLARLATKLSPFHKYVKQAEEELFNSARLKAIICNSKMVRDEIANYFPNAADKAHVIYSAIDSSVYNTDLKRHRQETRSELGIGSEDTVLLFVGSGFERKGLASAIRALAKSNTKNTSLVVIGKDKKQERYRKLAQSLDISDRIIFLGVKKDVSPYYGSADAFIFPTLYDPFPNVIIEAMASGLPVITSTKCGAAEIIDHGTDGFVCDSLNTDSIAAFIQELQNKETLTKMSEAAHNKSAIFSKDKITKALTDLYTGLLNKDD